MIVFERCDPFKRFTCRSPAEIDNWMSSKWIVFLKNERKFVQHKFDDGRLTLHSTLNFYPLTAGQRLDYVEMVNRSEIAVNDEVMSVGGLGAEEFTGFSMTKQASRVMSHKNNIHNALTFELSQTRV